MKMDTQYTVIFKSELGIRMNVKCDMSEFLKQAKQI